MTEPDYAVAPNPALAEALRKINIPPNLTQAASFRDYMPAMAEHGVGETRSDSPC